MALHTANVLSICTGGGGLDRGVRLACEDTRTVCYVEREAFAVANLVAAIKAGVMDDAPVWSDLAAFNGNPWCGVVDWLVGGIPCQPHSVAGLRRGADDERDLWPVTARIIEEVRPGIVFLENVGGIVRYYWDRIRPEFHKLGYQTQEGLFSAEEVGAPHRRQRLFVLAHSRYNGWGGRGHRRAPRRRYNEDAAVPSAGPGGEVANGTGERREGEQVQPPGRPNARREGKDLADGLDGCVFLQAGQPGNAEPETGRCCSDVPDAVGCRWGEDKRHVSEGEPNVGGSGCPKLPDTVGIRLEGVRWPQKGNAVEAMGRIFPPGPDDLDAWSRVLAEVPSLEPAFCRVADGLAATSDRAHRLRLLGNGVVPLVAATAFRTLAARAGIKD